MNKIENWKLVFEIAPCKLVIAFSFIHKRAKILPTGQHPGLECSIIFSRTRVTIVCACAKYLRDIFNFFLFSEFGVVTRFSMRAISELEL